ncbi:hypothetical protein GUJ93_ZPchr0002g25017 [Zizania palustris]|uniref:Uncharacterized protein n=1 Tax=Zizania palustris TaxID=103762 RepID=A0A8J5V3X7_ZIZPA|nr:hypothetical protein GUJ93_ZPchr0002g25017 [Zizania palustris]
MLGYAYAGFHAVSRLALDLGVSKLVFPVYRNLIVDHRCSADRDRAAPGAVGKEPGESHSCKRSFCCLHFCR